MPLYMAEYQRLGIGAGMLGLNISKQSQAAKQNAAAQARMDAAKAKAAPVVSKKRGGKC